MLQPPHPLQGRALKAYSNRTFRETHKACVREKDAVVHKSEINSKEEVGLLLFENWPLVSGNIFWEKSLK